ncbi:hypothetical protein, partial [Roseibium sp.]|uniref:hypothetical protein n=1 Tax=Roseibium sp. TaxID=1936156 RepID=UPI00262A9933
WEFPVPHSTARSNCMVLKEVNNLFGIALADQEQIETKTCQVKPRWRFTVPDNAAILLFENPFSAIR